MSWANMQAATFRGLKFNCLAIDDAFDHAIVEHRYPYVPGADIEDMGRGPRSILVQAFFYGDSYEIDVANFLNALYTPGSGAFVHPIFGSLPTMQVVRGSIHHDEDGVDQAHVQFELLESTAGNPFFTLATANAQANGIGALANAATSASAGIMSAIVLAARQLSPLNMMLAVQALMNAPIAALAQLSPGTVVMAEDLMMTAPIAWANQLTSLSYQVMALGGLDPLALLSGFNVAVKSVANVLTGSSPSPIANPAFPSQADAVSAVQVQINVALASSVCLAASAVLQSESVTPRLSPSAIQALTNSARTQVETAITMVAATYPVQSAYPVCEALKSLALGVQQAAQTVIVSNPPLITRQVVTPVPLRLLAFYWYGDNTRATQLMLLNELPNPNFLQAADQLVCYAS